VTASLLEKAALHYLARFQSSSTELRRVLLRRVERAARAHGGDPTEGAAMVEALITRYRAAGLLDDDAYAAAKAASLQRRGTSRQGIRSRLVHKGIAPENIARTLEQLDAVPETGELAAAAALARRRRLGPYRKAARDPYRMKDLAALARAGFSHEIARRVLDAADGQALEALVAEETEADDGAGGPVARGPAPFLS
jgi:regulatory protein